MDIHSLFNARPQTTSRALREGRGADGSSVPILLTPQSLVTFPIATFAIKLISVVVGAIVPTLAGNLVVLFVASIVVGGFMIFYSWQPNWDSRQKAIAIFVGALNTLYLFAVSAGLPVPELPVGG
ncbi:MAG: hypothetical protein RMM31_07795 [Anaerolineae bacterium]|nr:hypothetical protein [Thermoflexales bacterium]MDW8396129.1 hypothetical protein [Anaerolineae bacterium]